jgi:non-specific serine/threonine protein kinase
VGTSTGSIVEPFMDRDEALSILAFAEKAEPELTGPRVAEWLDRLDAQHDRIRDALAWLLEHDDRKALRLGAALSRFWRTRGHYAEGRGWLERALVTPGAAEPTPVRAKALYEAGLLAFRQGDQEASRAFNEEALEVARKVGDPRREADALVGLARMAFREGDHETVRARAEEAMAVARSLDEPDVMFGPLHLLAAGTRQAGDYVRARALYEESLALSREHGDERGTAMELLNLAAVEKHLGNLSRAGALLRESIPQIRAVGDDGMTVAWLVVMAGVLADGAEPARGARLLGAVDAVMEASEQVLDPDDQAEYEQAVASARTSLGDAEFGAARDEGKAMSIESAVAFALT